MSNLFDVITHRIIAEMENSRSSGKPLWNGSSSGIPVNFKSKQPYSGINILTLWLSAEDNQFTSNQWLTYQQARELGGQVRKGASGALCVYYKAITLQEETIKGEVDERTIPWAKSFTLFNLGQIDGLVDTGVSDRPGFDPIEDAEAILQSSGAKIVVEGARAFYSPSNDEIHLPDRTRFTKAANFYAVALHELVHWTGQDSRLGREFGKRFGDEAYAFEELVADLGSAFLNADLGLIDATLEGHASYLNGWLSVLKRDKKAIFTAASQAAKAHKYIMDLARVPLQICA